MCNVQTIKNTVLDTIRHFACNAPQNIIVIGLNRALYAALQANLPEEIEALTLPAEEISKINF